ncbi:MAG: DUF3108 domain-containing protein [Neomegalonema sp.]|nr:DUF3108 domain-containing protein [Neomegalonema sp.]
MTTLRHLHRRQLGGLTLLAALAITPSAATAQTKALEAAEFAHGAAYRIYLGGARVAKAQLEVTKTGAKYRTSFNLTAGGIVKWFYKATIRTIATGAQAANGAWAPALFTFRSRIDKKSYKFDLAYSDVGPRSVEATPPFSPRPWQLDPAKQIGALDPNSTAMRILFRANGEKVCKRKFDIYDGRRRYTIMLTKELRREKKLGDLLVDCVGIWKRTAGFKPKYMKLPGHEFKVQFHLRDDGVTWPVRAWAATSWGDVTAVIRKK